MVGHASGPNARAERLVRLPPHGIRRYSDICLSILVFELVGDPYNAEDWVKGVLAGLADVRGFEICRRFTELPPIGYYDAGQSREARSRGDTIYAFRAKTGEDKFFLPIGPED